MGSLICAAVWIPLSSDREFWELFWSRGYDLNIASQAIVMNPSVTTCLFIFSSDA